MILSYSSPACIGVVANSKNKKKRKKRGRVDRPDRDGRQSSCLSYTMPCLRKEVKPLQTFEELSSASRELSSASIALWRPAKAKTVSCSQWLAAHSCEEP